MHGCFDVLVNDATRDYGIFIEKMLDATRSTYDRSVVPVFFCCVWYTEFKQDQAIEVRKMIIETERLYLREMTENDFDALYKVLADSDIMQHYPYAFDEARVRNWIQRNIERYRILGFGLWAVCLKETGEMIGDCGLTMQLINGQIKPEIGYHIRRDQQRKGYAKEAALAVRDWTFNHTPFHVLYSYMKYTNEPSYKTAMSLGCKQVDEFEDDVNGKT